MVDLLLKLCSYQPNLLLKLINKRILVEITKNEKTKNETKERPFFDMLVFHREQEVREMAEFILTKVSKILFKYLKATTK